LPQGNNSNQNQGTNRFENQQANTSANNGGNGKYKNGGNGGSESNGSNGGNGNGVNNSGSNGNNSNGNGSNGNGYVTEKQVSLLFGLLAKAGIKDRAAYLSDEFGIDSDIKNMSKKQGSKIIEHLLKVTNGAGV